MALPGMASGQYTADGLTHNTLGSPSSQAKDHVNQLNTRQRKLETFDWSRYWETKMAA